MNRLGSWLSGHAWTIGGDLRHRALPYAAPAAEPFEHVINPDTDGHAGPVRLEGRLHRVAGRTLVLAVHGLGGDMDSGYCVRLAGIAVAAGMSCLRLSLRGAANSGEDVYHAGLTEDLASVLTDPVLEDYDQVAVVGFSLGGHVSLRLGLEPPPTVRATVAISAPLDLAHSCEAIDRKRASLYRHVVLGSLARAYRAVVAAHGEGGPRTPCTLERLRNIRTIHSWDEAVVVPRHGFGSVTAYHRSMSVGPRLSELAVPSLYIGARADPMVPFATLAGALSSPAPELEVYWADRGGHIAMAPPPDLAFGAPNALAGVIGWIQRQLDR